MKILKLYIIIFLLSFSFLPGVVSQSLPENPYYHNIIEPVTLELSKYPHGKIQWQESENNGLTWTDIPGANEISFLFSTDTTVMVRAIILSGSCDTLISGLTSLISLEISTLSVDNITDSSAQVNGFINSGDANLNESGIFYDTKSVVDENSQKISLTPPSEENFTISINGLQAGVTYYVRAYSITSDEQIIYGNILQFTPVKIEFLQNLNAGTDSLNLKYQITGPDISEIDEHGIFINAIPGSISTADTISGTFSDGIFSATASPLSPGTDYYAVAWMRTNDAWYFSDEKKVTTWSEYPEDEDTTSFTIAHRIVWNDPSSAIRITPEESFGEYGRVERIGNTDTLLLVYHGGTYFNDWHNIYLRKSYNNGADWEQQETLMDINDYRADYWRFVTPEILYLQNGWILIAFEANARPDENESSVQILISKDSANTWEPPLIYKTGRTWEPSMVQLPNGEIELFYSSEAAWWPGDPLYQDIQVIRSTDNGLSWSDPQVVAYYPQKRDGMPVPLVLQDNKGVIFAIETVNAAESPYIIHRDMNGPWILTVSNFDNSQYRWLEDGFTAHGGAPYILQLPTGETVLSAHIYRGGDWHQNNYQQVMIGDNKAKNFEGLQYPWGNLPWGQGAINNSLFLKNDSTIVTISTRMFDGEGGIYWLEGEIVPK